jgi:hypothetical protein
MRPLYLTPKLTDADRLEMRRLRGENAKKWTLRVLAGKFGVNRSTVSRALEKPLLVPFKRVHESAIMAAESLGQISTRELIEVKHQEWSRQLLFERDLGRQQQLVNLIKSVAPMLESGEALNECRREPRRSSAELRAEQQRQLEAAFANFPGDGKQAGDAMEGSAA